jgi:hypothetical protein
MDEARCPEMMRALKNEAGVQRHSASKSDIPGILRESPTVIC